MRLLTDNEWHDFLSIDEVPEWLIKYYRNIHEEEFDQFLKYNNSYYHLSDFKAFDSDNNFDGFYPIDKFGAIVIKISNDGGQYQIGTLI